MQSYIKNIEGIWYTYTCIIGPLTCHQHVVDPASSYQRAPLSIPIPNPVKYR